MYFRLNLKGFSLYLLLTFKWVLFPIAQLVLRLITSDLGQNLESLWRAYMEVCVKLSYVSYWFLILASNLFFSLTFALLTLARKICKHQKVLSFICTSSRRCCWRERFFLAACIHVGVCVAAYQNRLGNWCGLEPTVVWFFSFF